jgi:hypothetical protein
MPVISKEAFIRGYNSKLKKNYDKHRDCVHNLISMYLDTKRITPDGVQPIRYGDIKRACYYIPAALCKLNRDVCIYAELSGVKFTQTAHFNKQPKDFGFEAAKPESLQ